MMRNSLTAVLLIAFVVSTTTTATANSDFAETENWIKGAISSVAKCRKQGRCR